MMKFIFDIQINIAVFYNLILSFWVSVSRHAQCTQNNISRKTWKIKLIFHLQINVEGFFKLLLSCAKYLHILRKSSHVSCYLLLFRTSIYDTDCCLSIKISLQLTLSWSVSESYLLTLKHFTKHFFVTAHWLSQIFILRIS